MFAYSFRQDGPWLGEHETAQAALDDGRRQYEGMIYVGSMEQAYWSDMFIGAPALLSYMQEEAADLGDDFVAPFEILPAAAKRKLGTFIRDAIGEWEAELPEELQFTGSIVKRVVRYGESAMVRPADFPETDNG